MAVLIERNMYILYKLKGNIRIYTVLLMQRFFCCCFPHVSPVFITFNALNVVKYGMIRKWIRLIVLIYLGVNFLFVNYELNFHGIKCHGWRQSLTYCFQYTSGEKVSGLRCCTLYGVCIVIKDARELVVCNLFLEMGLGESGGRILTIFSQFF